MFAPTVLILAAFIVASAAPVEAQGLEKAERICAAAKLKAIGQKEKAKLKCEAIALQKELVAPAPECITKAETKFVTAFDKAEGKGGCVSELDTDAVGNSVDGFVAARVAQQTVVISPPPPCDVVGEPCGDCGDGMCSVTDDGQICVTPTGIFGPCPEAGCPDGWTCQLIPGLPPLIPDVTLCLQGCGNETAVPRDKPSRLCAAAKLKATAKQAHSKLKCEAKSIVQELAAADPVCLDKAETKFGIAYDKAEAKGGCFVTGDDADVVATVDDFVYRQMTRQTTGVGLDLPWCPTPGAACGSCGPPGMCYPSDDQGPVCVAAGSSPCPVEGCPAPSFCLTGPMGMSACMLPCP